MNWTIDYIENENYVRGITEGQFTVSQQFQRIEDLVSQKYWKPGLNVLFDNRKADFTEISLIEIRNIIDNVETLEEQVGDVKIAILMFSAADFGKWRQFEMLTEEKVSANIRIFMNEKQALGWLSI